MENKNKTNEPLADVTPKPIKERKSKPVFLIILIIFLLGGVGAIGYLYWITKTSSEITINSLNAKNDSLKSDIDNKIAELQKINVSNDSLKKEIENYIFELQQIKDALEKEKKFGDAAKLRAVQGEYNKTKARIDELLAQISDLQNKNTLITKAKDSLNIKLNDEIIYGRKLQDENKGLTDKVTLGSILNAYKINFTAVQLKAGGKKEKIVDKASKVNKLIINYTIAKNLISQSGNRTAYIRIIDPMESVFTESIDGSTSFDYNGTSMLYTLRQDFQYENKEQDLSIYYQVPKQLTPGKYNVEIYEGGTLLGTSSLTLK